MNVSIIAFGSRGDVQPLLALGTSLQRARHRVRFVSERQYAGPAAALGLDFCPVEGDIRALLSSESGRRMLSAGRNPLAIARTVAENFAPHMREITAEVLEACRGMDALILGGAGFFTGAPVAEKLEIPFIGAYVQPLVTPTRDFPNPMTCQTPFQSGWVNLASFALARQLLWLSHRQLVNDARRAVLDLPPWPLSGPFAAYRQRRQPVLYGYSPAVLPKPADWPDHVHVTGYWFTPEETSWQPPAELEAFLEAGPPPVYIGFGSMNTRDPERTAELSIRALEMAGQRGILLTGWGGLQGVKRRLTVFFVDDVPHDWLFRRVAAVVHHGGAGTTHAAFRAGAPQVVIPFFGDQPFWGSLVQRLGAGSAPIPHRRLTPERLAAAIQSAVDDVQIRRCAQRISQQMHSENGVLEAVSVIERYVEANSNEL